MTIPDHAQSLTDAKPGRLSVPVIAAASRRAEPWTLKDLSELKAMARKKLSTRDIGIRLGRSEASIRGKIMRERIRLIR